VLSCSGYPVVATLQWLTLQWLTLQWLTL
jgi:hypothetical protein